MNLELAILHTLAASPRALNAQVIAGFVPGFTGKDETIADITAALRRMEAKEPPQVKGTANEDRGTLWKETDDGRLRLA